MPVHLLQMKVNVFVSPSSLCVNAGVFFFSPPLRKKCSVFSLVAFFFPDGSGEGLTGVVVKVGIGTWDKLSIGSPLPIVP